MANKTCPGCGAEMSKIQGYNFVCQYCGTVTPVDPQTRAMIDAQQRQRIVAQQIENNKIADKKFKKGCLIAVIYKSQNEPCAVSKTKRSAVRVSLKNEMVANLKI